jgi:hypothetical protein
MWPEPETPGTLTDKLVGVAVRTGATVPLIMTAFPERLELKPAPVMDREVPAPATVGEKELIVGAPGAAETVNVEPLVTVPFVLVTVTEPVVAPAGTVTFNSVVVPEITVAAVPLKRTVFWLGVAMKPEPRIVTVEPTAPLTGEIAEIVS